MGRLGCVGTCAAVVSAAAAAAVTFWKNGSDWTVCISHHHLDVSLQLQWESPHAVIIVAVRKLLAEAAFRFFLDDDLRESSRFRFGNFPVRARSRFHFP